MAVMQRNRPKSYFLKKATLINTIANQPWVSRKFTQEGKRILEKGLSVSIRAHQFDDIPYKKTALHSHDSNNKNITELVVTSVMKGSPVFSKTKREKESLNYLMKTQCLFNYFSITTTYLQAVQQQL